MKKGMYVLMLVTAIVAPAVADTVSISTRWGKYFTAVGGGGGAVNASTRSTDLTPATYEKFTLVDAECLMSGDSIGLRTSGGKYIGINAAGELVATATSSAGATEKFTLEAFSAGLVPRPATVALKASNGYYVCAPESGVLKANCSNGDANSYFSFTLSGGTTGAFTVTPVVNMGSPVKAGTAVTLTANTSGGAAGTSQYQFVVKDANGSIVLPASPTQPSFSGTYYASWTPSTAGNYSVAASVRRYCQGVGPLFEATGTITEAVTSVSFVKPVASPVVAITPGSTLAIQWTTSNSPTQFKNGSLAFFDEAMYTSRDIANLTDVVSGTYTWTLPTDLPVTNKGRIRLTSFANASLSWDSAVFTVVSGDPVVDPNTLQWTWTTTLTEQHFTVLGVTLEAGQLTKLRDTTKTYTIGGIINSGSGASGAAPDRLYDGSTCATCHTASGSYKYKPTYPVSKTSSVPRGDNTSYSWNQTGASGIVQRFIDSPGVSNAGKPDMLEKLFKKWLDMGAQ